MSNDDLPLHVLFICSRNQWRSPTGEAVFRKHPQLRVRSAGTSPNARRHLTAGDIRWADCLLVMEEKHRAKISADYSEHVQHKSMHVLDIPDIHRYMAPELVSELKVIVPVILSNLNADLDFSQFIGPT